MKVRVNSAWRVLTSARFRLGGSWKRVTRMKAYVGDQWHTVANFSPPITASATPLVVSAFRDLPGTATTYSTTATPSGGTAPFTYSWTRTAGGLGDPTAPSSAKTSFEASLTYFSEQEAATFTCVITDAVGATASVAVEAVFVVADYNGGGGIFS